MAVIVDTVEREGRTIAIYDNGMERDVDANKIIKAPPAALITSETAREMSRLSKEKRQERAAALLRKRITEATAKVSDLTINNSAAAVAEAGGILWEEIVLNQDAYHRDRLEAFEKLGKIADVIPNASKRPDAENTTPAQVAAMNNQTARLLAGVWSDVMQLHEQRSEVIDVLGTETDISVPNNPPDSAHRLADANPPAPPAGGTDPNSPAPPATSDRTKLERNR